MSIKNKINQIKAEFDSDFVVLKSGELNFDNVYHKYLGRKGFVAKLYPMLLDVDKRSRSSLGQEINLFKKYLDTQLSSIKSKKTKINLKLNNPSDLTFPGISINEGSVHPIRKIIDDIKNIFEKIGFSSFYGTEVDSEYYNFEALNIAENHPARDMQDTFYTLDKDLLRTQTSSSQIHFMEKNDPPIRILSPGRVYRNEDINVRSYCLFHQIEGLYVDKNVTFADLKGTLEHFAKEFFGNNIKTRFRPSYFPFTEPSAEMDVYWGLENESDYRITKGTGWLEILGCGMVNNEVFKKVNYDINTYRGFAFGLGIERIAMLKYGIDDIRLFYEGDVRFLRQFK